MYSKPPKTWPEPLVTRNDSATNKRPSHSPKSQKLQSRLHNRKWLRPVKNYKMLN